MVDKTNCPLLLAFHTTCLMAWTFPHAKWGC